jgi:hypothetical protein
MSDSGGIGGDVLAWVTGTGVGVVVVETVRGVFQRRKMGGDYAERMAAAANALVEPLSRRNATLSAENENLLGQLVLARAKIAALEAEVARLKG